MDPDEWDRSVTVARRGDERLVASASDRPGQAAPAEYQTPPTDLLESLPYADRAVDEAALEHNAATVEQKLADLGVKGEVVEIHPGPVITMYELALASGIPLRKVLGMADDLAMALKSGSTRIVAPIPGKDTVGIEVPNLNREIVHFREIIESPVFTESSAPLKIALGKETNGEPFASSLARMPHLLIAGATGTGKSVGLNSLICSWLMTYSPDELKLLLVDPKKLELNYYQDVPHLLHPVVTEPEKVPAVLGWAIKEMERRYDVLSQAGAKNIDGYNQKVSKALDAADADEEPAETLPYIVIIVDELAELMMVAAKDIEVSIARLAQMARAAGIHLILATQRPSVDVITGIIKANFPARISFQVSAKADSRTILDTTGAESLLGRGDMLFLPPGTAKLKRLHGAYISETDIQRIVDFVKAQRGPVYLQEISTHVAGEANKGSSSGPIDDVKYDEAVELVTRLGNASISLIQRHMRIGYNRAARIIEAMEEEGIIGPSDGTSRPREVLVRGLDHIPDSSP
jgi:S-DNA-T family DNA segregation ATPase FtsK/SpoIIIE